MEGDLVMVMFRRFGAAVLLTLLTSTLAFAQGASVNGKVVDQQNAAVAGATLQLTSAGQPSRTVRSSADGTFTFPDVAQSSYTLRAEAPGFAQATQTVAVSGGSPVSVTVSLQLAGVVEDVTVQGAILGIAATGKTALPVRDLPLTIQGVPKEIIAEQGDNDLVTALLNTSGTYAFTTYGVYEYYNFRGFFDSVQLLDGVRNEGNRVNTQLTNVERVDVLKGPRPPSTAPARSARRSTSSARNRRRSPRTISWGPLATGKRREARSVPPAGWPAMPRSIGSTSGARAARATVTTTPSASR